MDEAMRKIAWQAWVDSYKEGQGILKPLYAACDAVLAEQQRREAPVEQEPQSAESFLARVGYSDSRVHSAPAIARLMEDYAAVAREGYVPASRVHGYDQLCQKNHDLGLANLELEQQLATMYTLEQVEKAARFVVLYGNWDGTDDYWKQFQVALARLAAPKPERVTVTGAVVFLDGAQHAAFCGHDSNQLAERYAAGLRAELAALTPQPKESA